MVYVANVINGRQITLLIESKLLNAIKYALWSILGPLLFLIYVNDLNNSTSKLSAIMFADDPNLFCSGYDLNQ